MSLSLSFNELTFIASDQAQLRFERHLTVHKTSPDITLRKYDGIIPRHYEGGIPRNVILGYESDIV